MVKRKKLQKKKSKPDYSEFAKWGKISGEINKKKGTEYFKRIGRIGGLNKAKKDRLNKKLKEVKQ